MNQVDSRRLPKIQPPHYYRSPKYDPKRIFDPPVEITKVFLTLKCLQKFIGTEIPTVFQRRNMYISEYFTVCKSVFQYAYMCISAEKYQYYRLINILWDFCRKVFSWYFTEYFRHLKFFKILTHEKFKKMSGIFQRINICK